jgi:hypothetical protein
LAVAALLFLAMKVLIRNKALYQEPKGACRRRCGFAPC